MTLNLVHQIQAAERASGGFVPGSDARVVRSPSRLSLRRLGSHLLRSTAQFGLRAADRLDPRVELAA